MQFSNSEPGDAKPASAKPPTAKAASSKAVSAKPARKAAGLPPETKKLLLHYVAPMVLLAVSTIVVVFVASMYGPGSKPADKKLHSGIRHIVGKYPALKPMYEDAMSDGVLTLGEADEINEESKRLKGN